MNAFSHINIDFNPDETKVIKDRFQKMVSVLSAHQIAVWEYDILTGECSFDNDYFSILGLDKAGISFKNLDEFYRFVTPEDANRFRNSFKRILDSEDKASKIKVRCIGKDGQAIWLEDNFLSYQEDVNGHPVKLIAYTANITSQCEKEERIHRLEDWNRKIIEAIPEFIFIIDDNFFIVDVMMSQGTILLHSVNDLIGADARSIYSPEVSDLFIKNIRECLEDGSLREIEYHLDMDGVRYYFQARIAPFEGNRVLALIHDNGERVKRAEELVEARRRAEEADRMKSVFLANMSHEIRTPLNAIVGFSNLLAVSEDEEEKKEYIDIIEGNNMLLLQLIGDILDLSKIEAGTMEFAYSDVDLNVLMNDLQSSLSLKLTSDRVELLSRTSLPECCIHTEKNRVSQIIINFVTNAIKFTKDGSITFGYEPPVDNMMRFYVTDTGCGIPSDKIDSVFDRFVKLNDFVQGTGLGLSICRTIIEHMGGEIGVDSTEGKGTTFWFTIPYIPVVKKVQAVVADQNTATEKEKLTVLVAEDNESNYKLFEATLKRNYNLLHAWDGQEAVDMYKEYLPQIVLMDINMPVMDGYEATKEIRKLSPDIPVIAVTALAFASDEQRILENGFNGYISKPIQVGLLQKQICEIMHGKK